MSTHYLEQPGGKIAYDDSGSGPLVVCAPSMGDLRGEYRFLVPQLVAAGYRVVNIDVRGHGETSAQWSDYSVGAIGSDLIALIRSLNAGPAFIIGTSMAAGAAVWAAAEAPDLVAGLVLVGPFVRGEGDWQSKLLFSTLFARPWGPSLWLKYYSTLYPTQKPADFAQYCGKLRANLAEPGRIEALLRMLLASKAASEERLPRVAAPALVIMGSKDPDFKGPVFKDPETEAQWVAKNLNGTAKMVNDAGHYPHAEMPEITGPAIVEFLQEIKDRIPHAT
jgi:pimeloyl-ACP methyl ester carboxylesterase